jgi:hypothetical protein
MRVLLLVLLLALFSVVLLSGVSGVWAQQNDAASAISSAQTKLVQCFDAAQNAESAGANVSSLTSVLNEAGAQLSNAELAYSSGNFGSASNLASQSQSSLGGFLSDADALKSSAVASSDERTLIFAGSIAGTFAVVCTGAVVWARLKRRNGNGKQKVNLLQYKALFIVVIAVLALLVASPALQRVLVYPQTDFFTGISLLGPGHMTEDYPYNITSGENYTVFLGINNQLGACAYYQVEVKFRNETQSAPDSFNFTPSSLSSLYNVSAFVADKGNLEIPVNFGLDYSFQNVTQTVYTNVTVSPGPGQNSTVGQIAQNVTMLQADFNSLMFNGETLNLKGYSSDWNPQSDVFYGNLVFELWIYNGASGSFQYNERFVDLKFNMTSNGVGEVFAG